MTIYSIGAFGRRNVTGLQKSIAETLCNKINNLSPKQVWTNSGCDGYWTEKPTHSAGEGHAWGTGMVFPNAKIEAYDGAYLVDFSEVFIDEAKHLV